MLDLKPFFKTFPVLETERLILRQLTPQDTADLFPMWSDPRVTRYAGRPPMTSFDQADTRVHMLISAFAEQSGISWQIVPRAHGKVVGAFSFWNFMPENFRAEIGYELAPDWWGQGLIAEAARAALTYGFETIGLHSVEAEMSPENVSSRRVVERLGFVQEGHFRDYYFESDTGQFSDRLVFSLLKPDWLSRST